MRSGLTLDPVITKLRPIPAVFASSFQEALIAWYDKNSKLWPWRTLWQAHRNPYHVWVSEVMLQQTVIKAVLPVYDRFLTRFPSILDLASAEEEQVKIAVRGLGYYRRFRHLHQAARVLVEGLEPKIPVQWPENFDEWKALPGVGEYTASAIASITCNEGRAVVDGNVERVLCRLFDIRLPPNQKGLKPVFADLSHRLLNESRPGDHNQAMMELGQDVCTPRNPNCKDCPVLSFCRAHREGSMHLAPMPKAKPESVTLSLRLTILKNNGKVGVIERPSTAKFLKGTRGFITEIYNVKAKRYELDGLTSNFWGQKPVELGTLKHTITKHRLTVTVGFIDLKDTANKDSMLWFDSSELDELLVANLDRKALELSRNYKNFGKRT